MARQRANADEEKGQAYREAAALCAKLRARGDDISLDAAAMIEGTLDTFAALVDQMQGLRDRVGVLQGSLRCTQALFARVPAEHRMRAAAALANASR